MEYLSQLNSFGLPNCTYYQTLGAVHQTTPIIEGLRERTQHHDIFLFYAHHSMVFYFQCSVY